MIIPLPEDPRFIEVCADRIQEALRPYEFRTFLLGFVRLERYVREEHEDRWRDAKIRLGDRLRRRMPWADVDFLRPDIRVRIGEDLALRVESSPLYIAGRYRKLSRSIPSSRWIHHTCKGRGCPNCRYTGSLCGPSIEEMLTEPALAASGGTRAWFHALGREDTDARMLGSGRPFVLEVHRPRVRSFSLDSLREGFRARAGDLAEVLFLAKVDERAVNEVKGVAAEKTYRAWIRVEGEMPADAGLRAEALAGIEIDQLSPSRVMHRRGRSIVRKRRIIASEWLGPVHDFHVWELRVEAGTYVKELVSGDGGRTRPSLAERLGLPCNCAALDVLEVHWEAPWESGTTVDARRLSGSDVAP